MLSLRKGFDCLQRPSRYCSRCSRPLVQNVTDGCTRRRRRPRSSLAARAMGIRAVESVDASFQLPQQSTDDLHKLLSSEAFCRQVVKECSLAPGTEVEFTEKLFQPVPWTPATKKGMPQEYEQYHSSPDYTIINVPPNFMFQAKIFHPSRLCAVFRLK